MPIDLTDFERGAPYKGDVAGALVALQQGLGRAQLSQIVHQRRAIIVIEGSEGGGKRDFVKLLGAALDPTHYAVTTVLPDRRRSRDGHWLARFWAKLPEAGHSAIFYHSWYRRVLEDKLLGLVTDKEWKRAFDEINEFESQQRDYGTLIVKLFFHVTDATQERRIAKRQDDQWQRHLVGAEEFRSSASRTAYRAALVQMLAQTDTRWAPWSMIDANDSGAAAIAGLTAIVDSLEKALPHAPPETASSVVPFMVAPEPVQPAG
ncbi:MAG: polyphosphate kinase [Sphingomonas bacterium]|nr:polyphosphate kinase [Sphingomonas bacterium]